MVKLMQDPEIVYVDSQLKAGLRVAESVVSGQVDLFSMKHAGNDKSDAAELGRAFVNDVMEHGSLPHSASPLGPLHEPATRKLLVHLILTLQQVYPEHIWDTVKPDDFAFEAHTSMVQNFVESRLLGALDSNGAHFTNTLWKALESSIGWNTADCSVFSFINETAFSPQDDPFRDGKVWSHNFFFVNSRIRRIVFLEVNMLSQTEYPDDTMDEDC